MNEQKSTNTGVMPPLRQRYLNAADCTQRGDNCGWEGMSSRHRTGHNTAVVDGKGFDWTNDGTGVWILTQMPQLCDYSAEP